MNNKQHVIPIRFPGSEFELKFIPTLTCEPGQWHPKTSPYTGPGARTCPCRSVILDIPDFTFDSELVLSPAWEHEELCRTEQFLIK